MFVLSETEAGYLTYWKRDVRLDSYPTDPFAFISLFYGETSPIEHELYYIYLTYFCGKILFKVIQNFKVERKYT